MRTNLSWLLEGKCRPGRKYLTKEEIRAEVPKLPVPRFKQKIGIVKPEKKAA